MSNSNNSSLSSEEKQEILDLLHKSNKDNNSLINYIEEKIQQKIKRHKEKSTKYKLLLENANDFISIITKSFTFEYVNESFYLEKLGYGISELIGKKVIKFIHPNDQQKILSKLKKGFERGFGEAEYRFKDNKGNWLWFKSRGKIIKDNDGNTKAIIISRDITDQKKTAIKLKNSEKKYKNIVKNLFDVIIKISLNGVIEYTSPQIYTNYGYRKEEILGTKIFEYIHPEDLSKTIKKFKELIIQDKALNLEYRVKKKDGDYVWVISKGKLIQEENHTKIVGTIRYIDEYKQTLEKLNQSEKRYRELFEGSRDGFVMVNENGEIIDANPAFCNMLEYTLEELKNMKDFYEITPKKWHKWEKKEIWNKKLLRKGYSGIYEKEDIRKSGEVFPIEIQSYAVEDNENNIKYLWGIARDITEKKQAQDKLRISKEKFERKTEEQQVLLDNIQTQVWYLTDPETYGLVNEAHAKFYGFEKDEMAFKNLYEIFPKDVAKVCKEGNLEVFSTRKQIHTEEWVPHHSGERRLNSITKTPKLDEKGNVEYVVCSAEDITERKKAERKLKESEQKYRDIAELLPDIIYEADKSCTMTYSNSIGFEKFGYNEEDLEKGINLINLVCDEYKEKAAEKLKKILSGKKTEPDEYLMVKKDGSKFYARVNSRPIYKNGKIVGIRGTVSDINKMVLAQEKINESEKKLKKLNHLKSELLRRTSHELKTPLVSIKGFTNLLLEMHHNNLDDDAISILNEVENGCKRLEKIISDILNTAKLESGRMELKKEKINLTSIIKSAINSVKGLAQSRNLMIKKNINDNLIAQGEKEKILVVLENLLSNAIKYTPSKGKIFIDSKKSEDKIIISIKDTRIGFTTEEKKYLFTQFGKIERYGEGYDINIDGSGLGLYISKKIIELHDGEIWMESKGRNKGSTFYFSLPKM